MGPCREGLEDTLQLQDGGRAQRRFKDVGKEDVQKVGVTEEEMEADDSLETSKGSNRSVPTLTQQPNYKNNSITRTRTRTDRIDGHTEVKYQRETFRRFISFT